MKGRKILLAFIISAIMLTSGCANGTSKTEEAKSEQKTTEENLYRFDRCCKIKNGVTQDFFDTICKYFSTKYIVFEFKNYEKPITQREIYTTEKYLYEKLSVKLRSLFPEKERINMRKWLHGEVYGKAGN